VDYHESLILEPVSRYFSEDERAYLYPSWTA
jgi:hypothetical protein